MRDEISQEIKDAHGVYRSRYTEAEWKEQYISYSLEAFKNRCKRDRSFYYRYYQYRHHRTAYYLITILLSIYLVYLGSTLEPNSFRGFLIVGSFSFGNWQFAGLVMQFGLDPFGEP